MKEPQKIYKLKVLDLNSNKVTEHNFFVEKGLHKINGNVIWNTKFDFQGKTLENQDQYFLSGAINEIRKIIEPKGYRILIKCCDYDAAHSGMQADMTAGTSIYKLKEINVDGRPKSYFILDESDIKSVVTLDEQNKNREAFLSTSADTHVKIKTDRPKPWWKF